MPTMLLVGDIIPVDDEVHLVVLVNYDIIRTVKLKREHLAASGDFLLDCQFSNSLPRTGNVVEDILHEMRGHATMGCDLQDEPMVRADFRVIGRCRDTDGVRMMLQHRLTGGFGVKAFPQGSVATVIITDAEHFSAQLVVRQ